MIRDCFFILFILSGLLTATAASPDKVSGRVEDAANGEPIAGVVIQAMGPSGKTLSFASSDAEGIFHILLKEGTDTLSFRAMGYDTLKLPASSDLSVIKMDAKATLLNDVIVEAPDIFAKGDTLVFNVGRYAKPGDNAIMDVLKRLPGIKVEDDGTIKYQGKPINKFYIDGNDFIGGQYGLAANNISHEDVKSVEVMENHQPVKALEGIEFPEEAGINLKLKEDARSRWVGVAKGAVGAQPLLFNASVYAMRLASKIQNVFTLKADNTGWNPANEITEHDYDDMSFSDYSGDPWPEYISADMVNAPLSEKRTRDNLSWLANGIMAWKRGDVSMRLKLNYSGDRLDYKSGVNTDYFSPTIPSFSQTDLMSTRSQDLYSQFNAEINKRGYYLKDRFTVGTKWDKSRSVITGSYDLSQKVSRKNIHASNDLKLVKRNEKKLFMLTSRNEFFHRPAMLVVNGDEGPRQSVGTTDFRSTTETRFGRMRRFWKFSATLGLDIDCHRMSTSLDGMGVFDNSEVCNSFLSNLYVTPELKYERSGWRLSLTVPIKWLFQSVEGSRNYISAAPYFNAKRQLTSKSDISGSVSYSLGTPRPYMRIQAPVLSDYRNLFIGNTNGKYSHSMSASLTYRYRNPLKALFLNATTIYRHSKQSMISDQVFIDDFIVSTYSDGISNTDSWTFNAGISKGLGHSRMVIGCDMEAYFNSASSMRNGNRIPYCQTGFDIKPYCRGSIAKWLSISYQASYGFSTLEFEDTKTNSQNLVQNLALTFIPHDRVTVTCGAEHYFTHFPEGNNSNLLLLDASASWIVNNRIRLSLTADNILNKRDYRYINYGTLSRSEYFFRLRPRQILASIQYRF